MSNQAIVTRAFKFAYDGINVHEFAVGDLLKPGSEESKIALSEGWASAGGFASASIDNEHPPKESWPPVPRLWRGETVAIFGSGESFSVKDAEFLRGKVKIIVVNDTFRFIPWADLLYACDPDWWMTYYEPHIWVPDGKYYEGAKAFPGLKVTQNKKTAEALKIHWVPSVEDEGFSFNLNYIHQGKNSGFQALNLAILMGAKRILLFGFDMKGRHFFGDHPTGLTKTSPYGDFMKAFVLAAPMLEERRIQVINCSYDSALNCFPKKDVRMLFPAMDYKAWTNGLNQVVAGFTSRTKDGPEPQGEASLNWAGSVTIATVLRLSSDFSADSVKILYKRLKLWMERKFKFVCLTDEEVTGLPYGVRKIPLLHPRWQTKHSKIELFRPDLLQEFGRVVYFDLDTAICGPIEKLVSYSGKFAMLGDVNMSDTYGSGIMLWGPDPRLAEIYTDFLGTPDMERAGKYPIGGGRGDQLFIRNHTPYYPHVIQEFFPETISFKKQLQTGQHGHDISVVYFHGRPKPEEIRSVTPHLSWMFENRPSSVGVLV